MAAPAASSISIRRCDPAAASSVLSSIGLGWPDVEQEVRKSLLRLAVAANRGDALIVVAAEKGGSLCGAVVAQLMPGKVATITPPQLKSRDDDLARLLLLQLDVELRGAGVELAQTLLAPDNAAAGAALRAGAYEHAADLLYLAAEADSFPDQPNPLPAELVPAGEVDKIRMSQLVDATYSGSLDCPRIDGLRSAADVLAGYRAVGDAGDLHWSVLRAGDSDVGCLLLADHRQSRQFEIVYVGLIPSVRGRGWGLELTRHAQWLARQANCERVVLAVDAANEPAIRIYSAAGFRAWDRQAVWIKSLAVGPTGSPATT
jgi:mycothiol synthase